MKSVYAVICILALSFSACVTGDEISSYVIDPDGTIAFSIYRMNLTSDQPSEKATSELAKYIRDLKENPGDLFAKANAKHVKVAILRKASPASVLITGRFPSLNDFAAFINEADERSRPICTPIADERTRGFLIEYTQNPQKENTQPAPLESRANSFEEARFALAEGTFTKAEGFLLSQDKRSALLDGDALWKKLNSREPSIRLSLQWLLPEAR